MMILPLKMKILCLKNDALCFCDSCLIPWRLNDSLPWRCVFCVFSFPLFSRISLFLTLNLVLFPAESWVYFGREFGWSHMTAANILYLTVQLVARSRTALPGLGLTIREREARTR